MTALDDILKSIDIKNMTFDKEEVVPDYAEPPTVTSQTSTANSSSSVNSTKDEMKEKAAEKIRALQEQNALRAKTLEATDRFQTQNQKEIKRNLEEQKTKIPIQTNASTSSPASSPANTPASSPANHPTKNIQSASNSRTTSAIDISTPTTVKSKSSVGQPSRTPVTTVVKKTKAEALADNVTTNAYASLAYCDWRPILAAECQVYVFAQGYIAKRFDEINYAFCSEDEAMKILKDNLYALLRFKYFPKVSDDIDDQINQIIKSFTANLKSTLKRVSLDPEDDCVLVQYIPDYCCAFKNGVYDFLHNCWLFKYDIIDIPALQNHIYMYDPKYVIMWYIKFNFEPIEGLDITQVTLNEFVELMKETTKTKRNFCFELCYNIAHDDDHKFRMENFNHLCEIMGYTILQSFSQHFVLLIGEGQNGKNTLFDGCFINRLVPMPATNSLEAIETDKFVTGSLHNVSHNFFLESNASTYTRSTMIKALTGSMYQTVEEKGVSKYTSLVNCKYIFSANNQDKIKFSDTSEGFRRRINMFEISYHYDADKKFMKRGDYYDTTCSGDLHEVRNDVMNNVMYVYLGMYGIFSGTNGFTRNFKFTKNDWRLRYSDADLSIKERLDAVTITDVYRYIFKTRRTPVDIGNILYDEKCKKLINSDFLQEVNVPATIEGLTDMFEQEELYQAFFTDHDVYIQVDILRQIAMGLVMSANNFMSNLKKIYPDCKIKYMNHNKSYVLIGFTNGKLRIRS